MVKNRKKIKTDLLRHSQAKVALYKEYLAIYLNILSRVKSIKTIFLFDLLCGEGLYENDLKGSPLVALDIINDHYLLNKQTCPNISIVFNDNGSSEIIEGMTKIERLRLLIKEQSIPNNVSIECHEKDFEEILCECVNKSRSNIKSKSLFFIDPYGYKNIKPKHIRNILSLKTTELILFLPASHMYRFANKCLKNKFIGSEALYDFLIELFDKQNIHFSSVTNFIHSCKEQFKKYLKKDEIFVDSFTIERDKANTYCLFFFTSNVLGFEKMLEAKWKIDKEHGKGFRISLQPSLFAGVEFSEYPEKLNNFIKDNKQVTNKQVYIFGLKNGYLPKHSNEVLKNIQRNNSKFELISLDGKPAKGFYITYKNYCSTPDRRVAFRINKQ